MENGAHNIIIPQGISFGDRHNYDSDVAKNSDIYYHAVSDGYNSIVFRRLLVETCRVRSFRTILSLPTSSVKKTVILSEILSRNSAIVRDAHRVVYKASPIISEEEDE